MSCSAEALSPLSPSILMLNKNTQPLASLCKLEKDIPSGPAEPCADRISTTSFLSAACPCYKVHLHNLTKRPCSEPASVQSGERSFCTQGSTRPQLMMTHTQDRLNLATDLTSCLPSSLCLLPAQSVTPLRLRVPGSLSSGSSSALTSRSPTPAPRVPEAS